MERELGLKRITRKRNRTYKSYKRFSQHRPTGVDKNQIIFIPLMPKQRFVEPNPYRPPVPLMTNWFSHAAKAWPPEAVIDWEQWGHRRPRRFFALWPELAAH
jgi:hypothetical protein